MAAARRVLLLVLLVLPALNGCKTQRTVLGERKGVDPIWEKFAGGAVFETDEQGNRVVKAGRRSQFEAKAYPGANREAKTSAYRTKDYAGTKVFRTKEARVDKEFRTSASRWDGEESKLAKPWQGSGQRARESGRTFATKDFDTKAAREDGREFATRTAPDVRGDDRFHHDALEAVRAPMRGEVGPTVRDIRSLVGKDLP